MIGIRWDFAMAFPDEPWITYTTVRISITLAGIEIIHEDIDAATEYYNADDGVDPEVLPNYPDVDLERFENHWVERLEGKNLWAVYWAHVCHRIHHREKLEQAVQASIQARQARKQN